VRMASPFFRSRGFTFVELCIGMVVTTLVLSALAAFTMATAKAWEMGVSTNSSGGQTVASISSIGSLAAARLDNEIANADGVGGYFAGNLTSSSGQQASLLLWNDTNPDGVITANEIELLEFNATDHTLYRWTTTSVATPVWTTFSSPTYIAAFKSIASPNPRPVARNIDGMQFYVMNASSLKQFPLVEYQMYFKRTGISQTRYGAACLRSQTKASDQTLN